MHKQSLLVLVVCICATMLFAQYEQFGNQPPQRESAEVRATRVTKMLRDTLKLDSEQFNDVYNVYYKEFSAMEQQMMPQGGPPDGMPPGGGGGMPPGGGGGMPPQGFGGGMPPQDMNGGNMSNPPAMPKELTPEQIQKQQAKRQKKMKRILTEEQYSLWLQIDSTSVPSVPQSPDNSVNGTQPIR